MRFANVSLPRARRCAPWCALGRTPTRCEAIQAMGVTPVQGDLRDRASLDAACRGVEAVISTASSMPFAYKPGENDIQTTDLQGVTNLVDAAKAAHVRHFIYTSFSRNIDLDFPLRNAKRTVERHLQKSGMAYTILRPGYFMEVWLSPAVGFDAANATAAIYGDGSKPLSWIAMRDVAEFAVQSLTAPTARNATIELGGPEALTPLQVVKVFEAMQGRTFGSAVRAGGCLEGAAGGGHRPHAAVVQRPDALLCRRRSDRDAGNARELPRDTDTCSRLRQARIDDRITQPDMEAIE